MSSVWRRWWRWFTNPRPLSGQTWFLEGAGPVLITKVHDVSLEGKVIQKSREHTWRMGSFLAQATLQPTVMIRGVEEGSLTLLGPPDTQRRSLQDFEKLEGWELENA